jgi:hypothetical protein
VEVAAQSADLVDQHLVTPGLEDVEVGMRAPLRASRVAEEGARERQGEPPLADPARTVEKVRVRRPLGERRVEQPLRLFLLR